MKGHMNEQVEAERHTMFEQSTEVVKERLTTMARLVEEVMLNKADEVFMQIRRDCLAVLGGAEDPQGEFMPKWERTMRQEVMEVISGCEKIFKKIVGIEDEEEEQEDHGEDVPEDDVKNQGDDGGTKVDQDVKIKPEKEYEQHDALGLQGTPETDTSNLEEHDAYYDIRDEIKTEENNEDHGLDRLGLRESPEVEIPSLEQRNESHDTHDVDMKDSPALEHHVASPATFDAPLLATEATDEISHAADITDYTTAEETAHASSGEEPTPTHLSDAPPTIPSLAAEPPANTSTDDPGSHYASASPGPEELFASLDSADQQLQNESRGFDGDGNEDLDDGEADAGIQSGSGESWEEEG